MSHEIGYYRRFATTAPPPSPIREGDDCIAKRRTGRRKADDVSREA
jgi:hypothetical protein